MDSKVNIELMIAKDILDAICSGWIRYLNGDKRDYNETLNRIYKIITTRTNKSIEDKPMEKKYRALRDYILNLTLRTVLVKGRIYNSYDLEGFAIYKLINQEYIEEVKENTLESIIDNNFIGDEIKKNLEQCIVKQKIELLYAIRSKDEPIAIEIDNKISELQKEIK